MTKTEFPRTMFCVDEHGLNVPIASTGVHPVTSRAFPMGQGSSIVVTQSMYDQTVDVNGDSWMDLNPGEQLARWGRVRFEWDELPEAISTRLDAERRAALEAERTSLLHTNPGIVRHAGAEARLREVERALAGE